MNKKNEERLLALLERIAVGIEAIAVNSDNVGEHYQHKKFMRLIEEAEGKRPSFKKIATAIHPDAAMEQLGVDKRTFAKHCKKLGITGSIVTDNEEGRDDLQRLKDSINQSKQKRINNIKRFAKQKKGVAKNF